jgi:UPF0716 protein FxsA
MLARLALLFIIVPLLELVILVQLGRAVGLWPTLGLVIVTGVLGAALARAEGLRTLRRFRAELGAGRVPGGALLDGLAVLVGGAFLLTPGLLTDVTGFALLLPPTRRLIQARIRRALERRLASGELRVFVADPAAGFPFGPFGHAGGRPPPEEREELDPRHEIRGRPGGEDL